MNKSRANGKRGIFLRCNEHSNEVYVSNGAAVVRARAMKRMIEADLKSSCELDKIRGVPWKLDFEHDG